MTKKVTAHAKNRTKVEAWAKDTEQALEGPEREALERVEAEGRSHATA